MHDAARPTNSFSSHVLGLPLARCEQTSFRLSTNLSRRVQEDFCFIWPRSRSEYNVSPWKGDSQPNAQPRNIRYRSATNRSLTSLHLCQWLLSASRWLSCFTTASSLSKSINTSQKAVFCYRQSLKASVHEVSKDASVKCSSVEVDLWMSSQRKAGSCWFSWVHSQLRTFCWILDIWFRNITPHY